MQIPMRIGKVPISYVRCSMYELFQFLFIYNLESFSFARWRSVKLSTTFLYSLVHQPWDSTSLKHRCWTECVSTDYTHLTAEWLRLTFLVTNLPILKQFVHSPAYGCPLSVANTSMCGEQERWALAFGRKWFLKNCPAIRRRVDEMKKLWNTFQRLRPEEFSSEINEPQYFKNR